MEWEVPLADLTAEILPPKGGEWGAGGVAEDSWVRERTPVRKDRGFPQGLYYGAQGRPESFSASH